MSNPSSRIINQLGLHGSSQGDAQMVEQLQLYKSPAIIRDMKQVFFYVQVSANSTVQSPLEIYTNKGRQYTVGPDPLLVPYAVNPYYTPLGTKRKFRVWEQVNSLLDLRVPDDKFFMELKLDEAQIEADTAGWVSQRDLQPVATNNPGEYALERSYNVEYTIPDPPTTGAGETSNVDGYYFKEALKKTAPQPLFCRIPQLDNGEPYNWTVINNGESNDDKSHGTVVIHGRSQFQDMDLEFGHLVFKGKDGEYAQFGDTQVKNDNLDVRDAQRAIWDMTDSKVQNQIDNYQSFEYLDYNWEWDNSEQRTGTVNDFKTNLGNEYVAPSARNGAILGEINEFGNAPLTTRVRLQNPPLKYNQQASSILFRFSVKLVHLF